MKIGLIIEKIDDRQLFVPAFQREYVWKRDNVRQLMRSLLKEYPTGTMLTWETSKPPELKGAETYREEQGAVKLILDGQQRITSLYMLMTGRIPPYYTEDDIKSDIHGLHVNVQTLDLEYYRAATMAHNPAWVDITTIFQGKVSARDIKDALEEQRGGERLTREEDAAIDMNLERVRRIRDREFLEQEVPVHADIKEAIDIFHVVNSSGIDLSGAELALAQICGYWPEARELFKAKLAELEPRGWVLNLDFIVFALLGVLHQQGSTLEKLHDADNKERLMAAWEVLSSQVLDQARTLLRERAYLDHTAELTTPFVLIPVIVFLHRHSGRAIEEEYLRRMVKWFYYVQLSMRYSHGTGPKLDKDLQIVVEEDKPFDHLLRDIRADRGTLKVKHREFEGRGAHHPLFSLMRWCFKHRQAVCFNSGKSLRQDMGKDYAIRRESVFSYAVLRDSSGLDVSNKFDYAMSQEIANRAFLVEEVGRSKALLDAQAYLRQVAENVPGALETQCIPLDQELWQVNRYKDFLKARRRLLAAALNEFLDGITKEEEPERSAVDYGEVISQGEHEALEFKSSMYYDMRQRTRNKALEAVIIKSVAAFGNYQGGRLIIGVTDDGEVCGLEEDYNVLGGVNKDKYEQRLRTRINADIGKVFCASCIKQVSFPQVDGKEICVIDILPSSEPVYVKAGGHDDVKFYVRVGNTSQDFNKQETANYIRQNFTDG